MNVQAKVVNKFQDKGHDNHIYEPGDFYPAEGYKADPDRIAFLSEIHPKYKKKFLSDVSEIEKTGKKTKGKANKDEGSDDKE